MLAVWGEGTVRRLTDVGGLSKGIAVDTGRKSNVQDLF